MAESRMILLGGGELKARETLSVDRYIAEEAKKSAGDRRACGLFLPTASHDCMPYYNTFHKVYTGLFDIKTDVALTVGREVDLKKLRAKFERADFLYVGGGNTVFLLEHWRACGMLPLVKEFYASGKLVCGLSAGAICWFETMYSDSVTEGEYAVHRGLGWVEGVISPHYDERAEEFDALVLENKWQAWGLENNAALELISGLPVRSHGEGKVWRLDGRGETLNKRIF